jgi:integrase/recombinase XerD
MGNTSRNFRNPSFQEPDWLALLFSRFDQYSEIRNLSSRTAGTQRSALRQFAIFLVEIHVTDIQSVTRDRLLNFQRWFYYRPTPRGGTRTIASQNRVLSVIKSFFHFLKVEGYVGKDPSEELEYGREPQRLPRNILTPEEARKIIETPDTSTYLGYRDRTILEIFYATGIRKNELMNLTLQDVNLEEELLRINCGKGAKDRMVPLSRMACAFLENYIKVVRAELLGKRGSDRLILSMRGRAMSKNALGALVEKYACRAGVRKHVTCHLWRHTCATHLLKNKANLRHVQEILGHRSLATTERYLSLTITDLKAAHQKCHPRERDHRAKEA